MIKMFKTNKRNRNKSIAIVIIVLSSISQTITLAHHTEESQDTVSEKTNAKKTDSQADDFKQDGEINNGVTSDISNKNFYPISKRIILASDTHWGGPIPGRTL